MKWPWQKKNLSLDDLVARLEAATLTTSGEVVTPENCMESPTVQAVVTAVSRRISVSSLRVFQTSEVNGRLNKEWLPRHPTQRLLDRPNDFQTNTEYWLDSVSSLVRWGNYVAVKNRGQTGPVRSLRPIPSGNVQLDDIALRGGELRYRITFGGDQRTFDRRDIHHVRTASRNYVWGDSPINDVRETIALEIAAEKFGGTFFGNGALPLMVFSQSARFKSEEQQKQFIETFQAAYSGRKRHRALLLPSNISTEDPVAVNNERSQFLETRQHQRTVIAGAFGVPPHLVGDLTGGTFSNVEQQDKDFVINVVLPFARIFEAAMERDLLTDEDRRAGRIIRFNLDEVQRADFKARQEGLWRQRQAGVISANDWRERENMNPIAPEDGGDDYLQPSNMLVAGEEDTPPDDGTEETDGEPNNVARIR